MTITLPDDLEERLKTAARARGVHLDTFVRTLLERAVTTRREPGEEAHVSAAGEDLVALLAQVDLVRAMTPAVPQTDSVDLLDRARRERHDL
jgi:plasmid stability protein